MGKQMASATAIHTGDRLGWRLGGTRLVFLLVIAHVSIQSVHVTSSGKPARGQ
jgi:hypothetical protein